MAESFPAEAILSAKDNGFSAAFRNAQSVVETLGSKLKSGIGFGAFKNIGQKAIGSVKGSITGLIGEINSSSATWKTFQGNMEISGKTQKQIKATKKELQAFAEQTIYSSSDMASTFTKLDAVGTKNTTNLVKGFGGLAAAAEDPKQAIKTLSQQAVQMAAKPMVQWEDFRQMIDQTPEGIAAVAKHMGMSTQEMIKNVQNGKIKTDEFFDAITKVGTNDAFTKLATEYKSVDQAVDGLTETAGNKLQPAFDIVASVAIKGIKGISDALGKIDGEALATKVSAGLEKAKPYWDSFKSVVLGVGDVLKTVGGFLLDHAGVISKVIPVMLGLVGAYKGFSIVKSIVQQFKTAAKAVTTVEKAGSGASKATVTLKDGFNSLQKSAGIALIIGSLAGLALALKPLASLGTTAIAPLLTFGVVVGGLGVILANMGTKLQTSAVGIAVFAASISVMALAMAPLASSGTEGAIAMGAFGAVVAGLVIIFSTFGSALTAAIPAMLTFGATILMIGTGMEKASVFINALTPFIKQLGNSVTQVAGAISSAVSQIAEAIGGVLCSVMQTAGDVITRVVDSISDGFKAIGDAIATVVDSITGGFSKVLESVAKVIESIGTSARNAGEGFKSVAEGISIISNLSLADVGKALLAVSDGLGTISSKGQQLPEVAGGMQDLINGLMTATGSMTNFNTSMQITSTMIAKLGSDVTTMKDSFSNFVVKPPNVEPTIAAFRQIVTSAKTIVPKLSATGQQAGQGLSKGLKAGSQQAKSAVNGIANAAISAANSLLARFAAAGKAIGNRFTQSMQTGLNRAPSIASKAVAQIANKLQSGKEKAHRAGAYMSQGFANGMESCLGRIQAAANKMVAAADRAIQAKAKIGSPSRLTKSHGRFIAIGLGIGIRKGMKSVTSASKSLAAAAINTMKTATKSRNYESAASKAIDKYKSSMNSKVSKVTKSLNKTVDNSIKKLQKKNPKLKKEYSKIGKLLKSNVSKTIKSQGNKAIAATEKTLNALAKKYQEKYDKIASDRANYYDKLSDYGSLYSVDSYGFVALKDFKAQTSQVKSLGKNMEQLKKSLPYDLMRDIQNMDTASALAYTNELLKKGTPWLKQYGKDYTAFMNASKTTSNNYYKPYIDQLDKEYNAAVTSQLNKLNKQLNTIGQQATQGLVKGLTSKSSKKALKKAAKDLAAILTKSIKGKLKIHSPSRVFMSLGNYTGQGFVEGLNSMRKIAAKAMDNLVAMPQVANPVLAGNFGGELSTDYEYCRSAQYTVIVPVEMDGKEVARVTAPYTEAELNKRQSRENRKLGRR